VQKKDGVIFAIMKSEIYIAIVLVGQGQRIFIFLES
jgi:hypothetical protein